MSCCSMNGKCAVCKVGAVLVLVGALNWGLIGLGGFLGKELNVVNMLLGSWPTVEWIVYILVGLSALACALKLCKCCKNGGCSTGGNM